MRLYSLYLLFIIAIIALYGAAFAQSGEEPAGKSVFINAKCNNCHAVEAAGIEAKTKKKAVPELSLVSTRHNADFLKKYVVKQEKINDAAHPVAFKGTDAELQQLVDWFMSMKSAAQGEMKENPAPQPEAKPQGN